MSSSTGPSAPDANEVATQAWNDPSLHASHHTSHHSHQSHSDNHRKTRPARSIINDRIDDEDASETGEVDAARENEEPTNEDFTLRSTLVGLAIGALICLTNTTLGLQSGWITMASLQAALLGFGVFKAIPPSVDILGRRLKLMEKPFTPQENSVLQATAVALGGMPLSAGLVGILPALAKLDPERDGGAQPIKLGWFGLLGWCLALAFFGVFLAAPLRTPMILKEKLRFPSGTATAQLISVLHRKPLAIDETISNTSPSKARSHQTNCESLSQENGTTYNEQEQVVTSKSWALLITSFASAVFFTILSFFFPVLYALPIFDPFSPSHDLARKWGWWFTPSLSYVGQGIIMGLPTTVSMTLGAIVGWGILSPLATYMGWVKGEPLDSEDGAKGWIVWVSLAIMCSESIIGLVTLAAANGGADVKSWFSGKIKTGEYTRLPTSADEDDNLDGNHSHQNGAGMTSSSQEEHEPPSRLVPLKWVGWGLFTSSLIAVLLIHFIFKSQGIAWWATIMALFLSSILAVLAVRGLGETDLNPTSGIGKISQLAFAVVQPGNVVANLIAGAISEAGAMQAGDLMQDLKTGHLVGASPRSQFYGQMIGSTAGIFVSSLAYKLYDSAYEIPGPEFAAPSAAMWLGLARLVNSGHLPTHVGKFMIVSAAIFAVTGVIRTLARSKQMAQPSRASTFWSSVAGWLPSGIAFAVGILNTPNFSLARLVGGLIAAYYAKKRRQSSGQARTPALDSAMPGFMIIIIASGFVLGEGGASIVNVVMKQSGAKPISCWGCRGGCGSGCS